MRRTIFRSLAVVSMAAVVALGSGCASHSKTASATVVIGAPPAPRVDKRSPRPGKQYIWVQGHWERSRGQYVWAPGRWVKAKKNHIWVDGYWLKHKKSGDWVWVAGYWDPPGKAKGKSKGKSSSTASASSKSQGKGQGKGNDQSR